MEQNDSNINKNINNNNESISDSQKPFVPIEDINMINNLQNEEKNEIKSDEKSDLILKNIEKNQSDADSISLSGVESNSVKSSNNNIKITKKKKVLYEQSKKQIEPYQIGLIKTINNIEEIVKKGEKERNYKMKSEFEREKEYKIEEQIDIKRQIEEISKNNINEKLINHFNKKINQQEDLNNKYEKMSEDINTKIQLLKNSLPSLEEKVKERSQKLKALNKENLKLLEKIKDFESENNNNNSSNNNSSIILNNSQINNQSINILNNSDKLPGGIKINEIVKENEDIKQQYKRILELKKLYKNKRNENQKLMSIVNEMNINCFLYKKIFNEGMHEIGKELLKIHELKLDKVISRTNSKNSNSVYFQIVKDNINGNEKKNDEILKLPLINKNITKKYNYPIVEKSHPNTLIYNVVKNMLDQSHNSSKISNIKKNKIEWEEFKDFSAYQIYTILNMNKDVIKKLEGNLFPRKLILVDAPPTQDEESFLLINTEFY